MNVAKYSLSLLSGFFTEHIQLKNASFRCMGQNCSNTLHCVTEAQTVVKMLFVLHQITNHWYIIRGLQLNGGSSIRGINIVQGFFELQAPRDKSVRQSRKAWYRLYTSECIYVVGTHKRIWFSFAIILGKHFQSVLPCKWAMHHYSRTTLRFLWVAKWKSTEVFFESFFLSHMVKLVHDVRKLNVKVL